MLDAVVRQVVVSQKFDFCDYVDWLEVNRWAWSCTDVGMPMLKEIAKEERRLKFEFEFEEQSFRKQKILKGVRTFVRIRSSLPIVCTEIGTNELRHMAEVFESSYEECASLSESSTWKKACMAGLFGRNTLITLLPHLSEDFRQNTWDVLLQTAFFIGDIDSTDGIIGFFNLSKDDVPNMVSELDILFSNDGTFFKELLDLLPKVMEKRLKLIRTVCSLNRLDILLDILEVAKPVELDELSQILDLLNEFEIYKNPFAKSCNTYDKLDRILYMAALHGHLPIIQFLWPIMEMRNGAEMVICAMMHRACSNNQRSVLEFLLFESGTFCMQMAQNYVNKAFEDVAGGGHVELMKWLTRRNNDGIFVFPGLGLTELRLETLIQAIKVNRNWNGIQYLGDLKKKEDPRFADFELVDLDNTALCLACEVGNYDLVKYLLDTTDDGKFVFPLTNPAAQNNKPLVNAYLCGNVQIVKTLLEQEASGNFIYKGIDPSIHDDLGIFYACRQGRLEIVEFLLKMEDGRWEVCLARNERRRFYSSFINRDQEGRKGYFEMASEDERS